MGGLALGCVRGGDHVGIRAVMGSGTRAVMYFWRRCGDSCLGVCSGGKDEVVSFDSFSYLHNLCSVYHLVR